MADNMAKSGLELLRDTLKNDTPNTKALGRLLIAVDSGILTVNGQKPDDSYCLGEYFIHGGRIKFDLSQLNAQEQEDFFKFISNERAEKRSFATHRGGAFDASGSPAETQSGLWGAIVDAALALMGKSKHFGINLAIGGAVEHANGEFPQENGEWGHMYLHKDNNLLLMGIESSAPRKKNKRTGQSHSAVGHAGERSAFNEPKIYSPQLHEEQRTSGKIPINTEAKLNWATVTISPQQFAQMRSCEEQITNNQDYVQYADKIPTNAEKAHPDRLQRMNAWVSATKKGNELPLGIKIVGGLLLVGGILLFVLPIPVVSQALGSTFVGLSMGMLVGAGSVGIALFAYGSQPNSRRGQVIYQQNLQKIVDEADVNVHGSPNTLIEQLQVKQVGTSTNALDGASMSPVEPEEEEVDDALEVPNEIGSGIVVKQL